MEIVTAEETEADDTLRTQTLTLPSTVTITVGDEIALAGSLRAVVAAVEAGATEQLVTVVLPTAGEFATAQGYSHNDTTITPSAVTPPADLGALPYDVFVALRSYGLQGASPKQFFADQGFTLNAGSTKVAEGRVTDWNADLQQITLAGLKEVGVAGETALKGTLRDLVTDSATLISEIDASGGVIVGERVLVELTGADADTVAIGSALRFTGDSQDVEIGRVLDKIGTVGTIYEVLINAEALKAGTALDKEVPVSWTSTKDSNTRTGTIATLRVDAVVSAVLHVPGAANVVADKNRAEISPEQGDRVMVSRDPVDGQPLQFDHVGEVIGFDPEKALLSFAIFAEHLSKVDLSKQIKVVSKDGVVRKDAANLESFDIAELRLGSVRYDGVGSIAGAKDTDTTLQLEGLALGFDGGTGSGKLAILQDMDMRSSAILAAYTDVDFRNRDRIVLGINQLPADTVNWQDQRAFALTDLSQDSYLFDMNRTQIAVVADGGIFFRLEGGELRASTIKSAPRFLNYFGADEVFVHGTNAADIFSFDNTSALTYAFGHGGKDSFNIGSVIEVRQAPNPEGEGTVSVVETTAGTSTDTRLFGGGGNDYFQVFRSKGETWLFGDAGDDTFLVKATLGITNLGSGKGKNKVGFNRNAPLHIDGGSGFDTFILEGTEIGDQFVVYVDDDGVQQIKGAGVDLGSIQNVENIQINAIDGDDTIYVYGVNAETRLTVNAGRGNDTIQIGGAPLLFNPASQSINLDTTAPTALVPTVVYEDVPEFVPGFTRVERITNPDGTEIVRQFVVPGYTRIKKVATVTMVPVASTTQSERKRVSPDTARIAAQYDLSAFDNLVTLDGSAGADVVDIKLYGNTDGDRANGEFGVTTARDIQLRALKAIYGQSYVPSEDELIPVDSPDNETFGWLTGFAGNSQGIVLDNNELVRIQLGNASNNMILSGVDRDIEYVVLSMAGGDDTVQVGAMSEISDRILMLKTDLADYSDEVRDWFIDEVAAADRDKVLKQAAYDEVEATVAALDAWYASVKNEIASIDTELLDTDLAEQQRLDGKFIADLDPALRGWFVGHERVLARINATAQDLYSQALVDAVDMVIDEDRSADAILAELKVWFDTINFRDFDDNLPALQAKWERARTPVTRARWAPSPVSCRGR